MQSKMPITLLLVVLAQSVIAQEIPPDRNLLSSQTQLLESMKKRLDPHTPQNLKGLLLKPEVQQELQIDRTTYGLLSQGLRELQKKSMEISREYMTSQRENRDPEAARAFSEKLRALRQEETQATQEALNEIFPPESFERLKQIAYQIHIKEVGLENALVYGTLADEMSFSDTQWDNLAERAAELQQERMEKIQELNQRYDEKLLDTLTRKQREKYLKVVGEPFEYTAVPREQLTYQQLKEYLRRFSQSER